MSEYVVESSVPFGTQSDRPSYSRNVRKYPWHTMVPGDSFVVATLREAKSAHNSFQSYRNSRSTRIRPSWFASSSKQEDGTYRLWLLDKNNL
jgi:hypothetical protein